MMNRLLVLGRSWPLVLIIACFPLFITAAAAKVSPAAGGPKDCATAKELLHTLRVYHVDPPADEQDFSVKVVQQFVHHIDPQGLYLMQGQVEQLKLAFEGLEQKIKQGNCQALEAAIKTFAKQYHFVDSLRQQLLLKPLASLPGDTLHLSLKTKANYTANRQALAQRWQKQLLYLLLYEAYSEAGEGAISLSQEAQLRQKVAERIRCRRSKMMGASGGLEAYVGEQFLQAIATAFDPHTNYMPPAAKEHFEAALSAEAASFGMEVTENKQGDIEIAALAPGGPAWKSNELHEGDILLSLRSKKGVLKEFSCTSQEEAEAFLADAAFQHAFVTVRKKSGQNKTVELIKERLQVEENVVTSFVMKGQEAIGYLSLPAFYRPMNGQANKGAAHDIAKEIVQLKRAGIKGLILDLRFNGGGSVGEALNLAGIFIDEGPLGIEASKGERPLLLKDMNRGVLYEGPLVLLVNGFSASASEILAQTLQDYNRALIVGSATYGKSTVQVVLPVKTQAHHKQKTASEPFVKVTIGKYYGVKSSSYQGKGILPDVQLTDGISALGVNEAAYPTALKADFVSKKVVYQPLAPLPGASISLKSQLRLQQDSAYRLYQERTALFASTAASGFPVRLSAQYFKQDYEQLLKLYEEGMLTAGAGPTPFELENLAAAELLLQLNETDKEANQRLKEELKQDVWLTETYLITLDLLDAQK